MKTNQIYVNGDDDRIAAAMDKTSEFAGWAGVSAKEALRLRLISEELMGLLSGITENDYTALFWIEGNDRKCEFHLLGRTEMTRERRAELLETATNRKNAAATGIMGKIRDMIGVGVLGLRDVINADPGTSDESLLSFYDEGVDMSSPVEGMSMWSLTNYRASMLEIYGDMMKEKEEREPWDELERSIIANLADDVHVSIRMDRVEIVVYRTYQL